MKRPARVPRVAAPATLPLAVAAALLGACATNIPQPARGPIDIDVGSKGPASGTGIESRDIASMTDQMTRDLLSTPEVAARRTAPRIVVDSALFRNRSSQAIDKDLIVDKLRIQLNRSARGRLVFVSREDIGEVDKERALKRDGATDSGTTGLTQATLGIDFRLRGSIGSLDSRDNRTGMQQRYMQVTFEMLDVESGALVWGNQYEFQRAAADDVVYR
jgi:hypothetical protein